MKNHCHRRLVFHLFLFPFFLFSLSRAARSPFTTLSLSLSAAPICRSCRLRLPPRRASSPRASERRFELALTSAFVLWGCLLAAKKLRRDNPEELRHDPLYEVHHEPRETTGSKHPASVALSKKAGMMVGAEYGDPNRRRRGGHAGRHGRVPQRVNHQEQDRRRDTGGEARRGEGGGEGEEVRKFPPTPFLSKLTVFHSCFFFPLPTPPARERETDASAKQKTNA